MTFSLRRLPSYTDATPFTTNPSFFFFFTLCLVSSTLIPSVLSQARPSDIPLTDAASEIYILSCVHCALQSFLVKKNKHRHCRNSPELLLVPFQNRIGLFSCRRVDASHQLLNQQAENHWTTDRRGGLLSTLDSINIPHAF